MRLWYCSMRLGTCNIVLKRSRHLFCMLEKVQAGTVVVVVVVVVEFIILIGKALQTLPSCYSQLGL